MSRIAERTLTRVAPAWQVLGTVLRPIRDDKQYDRAQELLDALLDAVGGDAKHPLHSLLEVLGELMHAYEERRHRIPDVSGREMLRYFMELHELKQTDLGDELGGQAVVSNILNGKRNLNVRQIQALGNRFGVHPSVFLDRAPT